MSESSNLKETKCDQSNSLSPDSKSPPIQTSDEMLKTDSKIEKNKAKTKKEKKAASTKFNFFNKKHATNKILETSVNNTSTSSQIELNLDSISSQNENVNMIQGYLNQCEKLDDDEDEIQKNKCSFVLKLSDQIEESNEKSHEEIFKSKTRGILLHKIQTNLMLTYMYLLNYIPLGLFQSLMLTLTAKSFHFNDLAIFSFVLWPYCFKFIYAPFVNIIYIRAFGQRKTWICTCYFMIGLIFMSTAILVKEIFLDMQQKSMSLSKLSNITKLMLVFAPISLISCWSVSLL
jgi:hypothetical protein